MSDTLKLNRLNKFGGGSTVNDKDNREGTALVVEELDIFTNASYIQPETVLSAESSYPASTSLEIGQYSLDDGGNIWAIVSTKAIKATQAGNKTPGNFAVYASSLTTRTSQSFHTGHWHGLGDPITTSYMYYAGGTNTLYRMGDITAAGTTESSVGTLSGMDANTTHVPFIRVDGELFVGHGQFIAKVDGSGVFTQKAFTLPNNWQCVAFAPLRDELAILAKYIGEQLHQVAGECRVFLWDKTATTGVDDTIIIPAGGAQAIANHNDVLRAFTQTNGRLKIWELSAYPVVTHELDVFNAASQQDNTIGDFIVSYTSTFVKDGRLYFGVAGPQLTNKSGLYCLGKPAGSNNLALVLAKRYSNNPGLASSVPTTPFGALSVGPNIFCSFFDRGDPNLGATASASRVAEANSPTRTSNALYESILIDTGSPETTKDWEGFLLAAKSMPASTNIRVDARTDNASSFTITISSITRSGNTATATTSSAHNLATGDIVAISGATQSAYNITAAVTVTSTTIFAYTVAGTPTTPATGSPILTHTYDFNSLQTLDNTVDQQETGTTADTFYERAWTSLVGRAVQIRLKFLSSGTSTPQLYSMGLFSRDRPLR